MHEVPILTKICPTGAIGPAVFHAKRSSLSRTGWKYGIHMAYEKDFVIIRSRFMADDVVGIFFLGFSFRVKAQYGQPVNQ